MLDTAQSNRALKVLLLANLLINIFSKIILILYRLLANLVRKTIEVNDMVVCEAIINNVQILEECLAVDCMKYFLKFE